uniref:Uncharacterized protein n=1 Tax=Arundo donax TaxID=35708 RepID=A0A0A9DLA3_ARUDO
MASPSPRSSSLRRRSPLVTSSRLTLPPRPPLLLGMRLHLKRRRLWRRTPLQPVT